MKERMQKTLSQVNGCPQRDRSETEWYGGVQTFMWMCEDNIVEVPFDKEHLFEQILSPSNLNRAYKAVMRNKGCGGIDKMSCEQLLPWLLTNKDLLIRSLMDGSYRPNPVERVEIPKDNGKMRLLGIPTVVDRLVQQAINQVLTSIYENQFSKTSYGFRPRRGCHDALRGAQKIVNEGYIYVVDLERRGLPFVRYADDSMIFCKSKRAAMRVKESITRFIENTLYLKVNKEKIVVSYVRGVKYLGYSFYVMKGKCELTVHPKSKAKMKSRLKELTSRSNGWGYAKRKQKLQEYIRGWVGYYHLANMKRLLLVTDEWLRRRIRMCIWKAWKKAKTKVANLIICGINKYQAYEWGNTRKGYWRIADSPILKRAIDNNKLRSAGYATLMEAYLESYPK